MKERLDLLLVRRGLLPTRKQAKEFIEAGKVTVAGCKPVKKAGTMVEEDAEICLSEEPMAYVGRGALKLLEAMQRFETDVKGRICLDIGASTGGFTDCMLSHGAKKVYAIDVGHGQLAEKLKEDDRVINMERTNVRYLKPEAFSEKADFASVDVSFISLTKVLEPVSELLSEEGQICCLIKPQFEAGKKLVGKGGIVKDLKVHGEVLKCLTDYVCTIGLRPLGLIFSPIKGQEGNVEYLMYLTKE